MTSSGSTPQTRSKGSAGLIDPVEALRNFGRGSAGRSNKKSSSKMDLKLEEEETIEEKDFDSLIDGIESLANKVKTKGNKLRNNDLYASVKKSIS